MMGTSFLWHSFQLFSLALPKGTDMRHMVWIGRAFYWLCIALAIFIVVATLFPAVRDNHLHYLLGPIWVAAVLYVAGRTVHNWTVTRYLKKQTSQVQ